MTCVNPDGKPTESGEKMLRALKAESANPEDIAARTALPLFRVRSGLRELAQAGLARQEGPRYTITEKGAALVA